MSPHAPHAPVALVLLGHPVSHSLSPVFQQAALNAAGLDVRYQARDVAPAALSAALLELAASRTAGNVTIPHKEAVFAECMHHTDMATRVGAVNTFWFTQHGELTGHNTDVAGAVAAIRAVLNTTAASPIRVALLGAGGSAMSIIVALEAWDVQELVICARTPARAQALAARCAYPARAESDVEAAVAHADLVINTTPIGLHDNEYPVSPYALSAHASVLDLVYRRGETAWVNACRKRGHRAEDGVRMLVEQGAAAFESWYAREPDRDAMWASLELRPFPPTPAGSV